MTSQNMTTHSPIATLEAIAYLRSPFKEKFGIPRQPGFISAADAWLDFVPPYDDPLAFEGLDAFSHVWISFLFHRNDPKWRRRIRPPRLGGNRKVGVFASRSSFRPNRLGLSVVALKGIERQKGGVQLRIACPDILDQTPIVDIKPYIAYSDAIPDANSGYAPAAPEPEMPVLISANAAQALETLKETYPELEQLVRQTLSLDPRPAYKKSDDDRIYGVTLYDLNVTWQIINGTVHVIDVSPC